MTYANSSLVYGLPSLNEALNTDIERVTEGMDFMTASLVQDSMKTLGFMPTCVSHCSCIIWHLSVNRFVAFPYKMEICLIKCVQSFHSSETAHSKNTEQMFNIASISEIQKCNVKKDRD